MNAGVEQQGLVLLPLYLLLLFPSLDSFEERKIMSINYELYSLNYIKTMNDSEQDLRNEAKKLTNGYYSTQICRRCKIALCSPEGNVDTCPIIDLCKDCFSMSDSEIKEHLAKLITLA